jgi:alkaline phosphatase D
VLNLNSWDGYPSERERVLNVISNNNIDNVVIISGDMHVSLAADIPYEPTNPTSYIDSTGEGSICVEFAPPSISRGNFDEKGLQESFVNTVFEISNRENPNHQYLQLTKHGYGIMHFNSDSLKAQYWYCDILEKSNLDTLGKELILFNTENHWKRKEFTPTSIQEISHENGNVFLSKLYPNPAQQEVGFDIVVKKPTDINMSIYHMVSYKEFNIKSSNTTHIVKKEKVKVPIQHLPAGMYLLMIESTDFYKGQLFLKTE